MRPIDNVPLAHPNWTNQNDRELGFFTRSGAIVQSESEEECIESESGNIIDALCTSIYIESVNETRRD